jgi:hypothetical protein
MKKILVIAALVLVIVYSVTRGRGVEFTLNNVGSEVLPAVVVEVTGRSYMLGDVPPGRNKTVKLNATADSHIELRSSNGRRLVIDCYFEPGYGGSITANVTSQAVVSVEDQVSPSIFF